MQNVVTCDYNLYLYAKIAVKHENSLPVLIFNRPMQPCRCAKIWILVLGCVHIFYTTISSIIL